MDDVYPFFEFPCLLSLPLHKKVICLQTVTKRYERFHSEPKLRVESLCLCLKKEHKTASIETRSCQTAGLCHIPQTPLINDDTLASQMQTFTGTTWGAGWMRTCCLLLYQPVSFRQKCRIRNLFIVLYTSAGRKQRQLADKARPHRAFVQCHWLSRLLSHYNY